MHKKRVKLPPDLFGTPTWALFHCLGTPIGILRSDDGDVNGNAEKTIGLISKTTILRVHHAFFVHFFAVTARLRRENA